MAPLIFREKLFKQTEPLLAAKAKLAELKAASEATWENMVTEMEKIRDAFSHSFSYFKSQL